MGLTRLHGSIIVTEKSPKGAKGKVTKNKSSQKQKITIKNIVPSAPSSDAEVKAQVENAMGHLLSPQTGDTWALPRDTPVESVPVNLERVITVNPGSGAGVVVDVTPDLQECVNIYAPTPLVTYVGYEGNSNGTSPSFRVPSRMYPLYQFFNGATELSVASWIYPGPANEFVQLEDGSWLPGHRRVYAYTQPNLGDTLSTNFMVTGQSISPLGFTQGCDTYNLQFGVTSSDSLTTNPATIGTPVTNILGGIDYSAPLRAYWIDTIGDWTATHGVYSTINSSSIGIEQIQHTTYNPAPAVGNNALAFDALVSGSSRYSYPCLELLATFTGAELLNGGNIAIAVVPYSTPVSRIPVVAYDQLAAMAGNVYTGPLKLGVHGNYIPDDLTRVAFLEMDEKVKGRRLVFAAIPQTVENGPSSSVMMRLRIRSHIEFINSSQVYQHLTSAHGGTQVLASMYSSLLNTHTQVGENPDHIKRMYAAIKKAATDPRVIAVAKPLLGALKKSASVALPLLLAAL